MIANQCQCRGYRVSPLSTNDVRGIASAFLEVIGDFFPNVDKITENLLQAGLLHIVADNEPGWRNGVEGFFSSNQRCIVMRDSDYIGCLEGTNPRALFTLAHELGHLVLSHERTFNREEIVGHKYYEDSEWQADTFAAELLMPLSVIEQENLRTPWELKKRFGVSYEAAEIRLMKLKRI